MAFKMKAGKEGPMKKNFGKDISPMNKPLVGNQKNLPDHLKQKILDSPAKLKVDSTSTDFGKKHDRLRKKGHKAREKAMDAFDSGKTKKADRLDKKGDKKLDKAREIRSNSPKKFLGKALGGGMLGKAIGKVGKFAKKNPALAGMALGGPLGGLAGGVIGAMKKVDEGKKSKKRKIQTKGRERIPTFRKGTVDIPQKIHGKKRYNLE